MSRPLYVEVVWEYQIYFRLCAEYQLTKPNFTDTSLKVLAFELLAGVWLPAVFVYDENGSLMAHKRGLVTIHSLMVLQIDNALC